MIYKYIELEKKIKKKKKKKIKTEIGRRKEDGRDNGKEDEG